MHCFRWCDCVSPLETRVLKCFEIIVCFLKFASNSEILPWTENHHRSTSSDFTRSLVYSRLSEPVSWADYSFFFVCGMLNRLIANFHNYDQLWAPHKLCCRRKPVSDPASQRKISQQREGHRNCVGSLPGFDSRSVCFAKLRFLRHYSH